MLPLSEGYLALLFKAYRLRYPDELPVGFNIALDRTRLLTELDFTVWEIRKGLELSGPFGALETNLDLLASRKDSRLLDKNCYFGSSNRDELFRENAPRFTMRVLAPYSFVQVTYQTMGVPDTRNLRSEGIKVNVTGDRMEGVLPLE